MASLVLLRNPLRLHERETHVIEDGTQVIDWLQENHPNGFGMPINWYIGDQWQEIDDLDYQVQSEDVIVITAQPAFPAGFLVTFLIKLVVSAALSLISALLSFLFAPEEEDEAEEADPVFDVSSSQNAAKLGEPIIVPYGRIQFAPAYAAQPYTFYETEMAQGHGQNANADNELATGRNYLDLLLCLGQGVVDVEEMFVGETSVNALSNGEFQAKLYYPWNHDSKMGNIQPNFEGGTFYENMIVSTEVSNQEFFDKGQEIGPFVTCKRNQRGRIVQNDILFPGGINRIRPEGETVGRSTIMELIYHEVDQNDQPIPGTEWQEDFVISTEGSGTRNGVPDRQISVFYGRDNPYLSAPHRITITTDMGRVGRWGVKMRRRLPQPSSGKGSDVWHWTGMRMLNEYTADDVYGYVTLLAVRIKASNAIGNNASVRVHTRVHKRLQINGTGNFVQTRNPADAFYDIYCSQAYGAARPDSELDLTELARLKALWANLEFNYVYEKKQTVFEALTKCVQGMVATPLPIGSKMSIAQDGVKPLRSMMFSDANIVDDSFRIEWNFDAPDAEDGIEIRFLDPVTFQERFIRWPVGSVDPRSYFLPGCTDEEHAYRYARTVWNRQQYQRRSITFETEMEGLLLHLGDRIAVSHSVPEWGQSGIIIAAAGNIVTVDRPLDWSVPGPVVMLRDIEGQPVGPLNVTRGASDYEIDLGAAPPIPIAVDLDQEPTHYAFGGSSSFMEDYTVDTTTVQDQSRVEVKAVPYDLRVFNDGLPHLGGTITSRTIPAGAVLGPLRNPYIPQLLAPGALNAGGSVPPLPGDDLEVDTLFAEVVVPSSGAVTIDLLGPFPLANFWNIVINVGRQRSRITSTFQMDTSLNQTKAQLAAAVAALINAHQYYTATVAANDIVEVTGNRQVNDLTVDITES